jgi:multiple antibiotic resistance protein
MLEHFFLAFVPIFVAVDAVGILPIYVSLTHGIPAEKRRKVVVQSVITAISVAVAFVFVGKSVFKLLGISIGDFMIAGGAILFCIAILDILKPEKQRRVASAEELGAVPLGMPLIVGPAVLTTTLICLDHYGLAPTLLSLFVNVIIAGLVFASSDFFMKMFGKAGAVALSKVMALLLAAIAVMMIRKGVVAVLTDVVAH